MAKAPHFALGAIGEKIAENWLRKKGFQILERNWKNRQGEIDLICKHEDILVFVEVKTRREGTMTLPGQALTREKKKCLLLAASAYLSSNQAWSQTCRIDFVGVLFLNDEQYSVEYVQNVIEFSNVVGGSHSSWQPW